MISQEQTARDEARQRLSLSLSRELRHGDIPDVPARAEMVDCVGECAANLLFLDEHIRAHGCPPDTATLHLSMTNSLARSMQILGPSVEQTVAAEILVQAIQTADALLDCVPMAGHA